MKRFVITKQMRSYRLSTECDPSELPQVVKDLEQMAAKIKSLEGEGEEAAGEAPSIAGAGTTSDGIVQLFKGDWGSHPHSMREILEALNANGIFLPTTTLSSILFNLIRTGRLRRWKSGKSYVYHGGKNE